MGVMKGHHALLPGAQALATRMPPFNFEAAMHEFAANGGGIIRMPGWRGTLWPDSLVIWH
jgi:hypothetical protein